MSRVIDTRVAEMRFDNKDFEANVAQSMSTLDKLKQALNFGDAGKAFDEVSKAASGMNLSGIGDAVDTVKEKFSALEIAGITALVNLTNKAVDAGAQIVKSLTLDQVTAGWDKYAEKTTAVQTIMAATKSQFEDEGEQMAYVNEQLDKLNWFTDETSYNLVDMVSNIGKFTNAGISLDSAVTSMQGVATWAAISGANAQEASRAMYNLAQATGTGYMQMIDWKSIENANMATMEFKEMAIQAGLALGTLEMVDGEVQTVDTGLAKKYSAATVTAQNFASTLTSTAWLTNDVLNMVLDMYGGFTNVLNEAYNETGLETIKLLKYTEDYEKGLLDLEEVTKETGVDSARLKEIFEELSSPTYELGRRAFKAAQETKTFAEVINYTKDAVSSGWMNTFEIIFGDYEEAKAMWSDLSEVFYEIFVASGEARNEMLKAWKELGGRTSMLEGISNSWNAVVKIFDTVKEAFHGVFPATEAEEKGRILYELTKKFQDFSEKLVIPDEKAEELKEFLTPFFETMKRGLESAQKFGKQLKNMLLPAFRKLKGPVTELGKAIKELIEAGGRLLKQVFQPMEKVPGELWKDFRKGFREIVNETVKVIDKVTEWTNKLTNLIRTSEVLNTTYAGVAKEIIRYLADMTTHLFSLSDTVESFKNGGIIQVIADKLSLVLDTIIKIAEKVTGKDFSEAGKVVRDTIDKVNEKLQSVIALFENFVSFESIFNDYAEGGKGLYGILNSISGVLSGLSGYALTLFSDATGWDMTAAGEKVESGIDYIHGQIEYFIGYLDRVLDGEANPLTDLGDKIREGFKYLETQFTAFTGIDLSGLDSFIERVPEKLKDLYNYIQLYFNGEVNPLTDLAKALEDGVAALETAFTDFTGIDLSGFNSFIEDIPQKLERFAARIKKYISGEANPLTDLGMLVGYGFLQIEEAVADYTGIDFTGFNEALVQLPQKISDFSDKMDKVIGKTNPFSDFGSKLLEGVKTIKNAIFAYAGIDIGPFDEKTQELLTKIDEFTSHFDGFVTFAKGVWDMLKALASLVEPILGLIGEIFSALAQNISNLGAQISSMNGQQILDGVSGMIGNFFNFLSNLDWGSILGAAAVGGLAALGHEIVNFIAVILDAVKLITGKGDSGGGGGTVQALADFAKSVLMICGSIMLMAAIDTAELELAAGIIVEIMRSIGIIVGGLLLEEKFTSSAPKLAATAGVFTGIGIAVVAMAAAIKIISDQIKNPDSVDATITATIEVVGSLAALAFAFVEMSQKAGTASLVGAASVITALGRALKSAAQAIKIVAEIDKDNPLSTTGGAWFELETLLGTMGVIAGCLGKLDQDLLKSIGNGLSIYLMSEGLKQVGEAIAIVAAMDTKNAAIAFGELESILITMGVIAGIMGKLGLAGLEGSAGVFLVAAALDAVTLALIPLAEINRQEGGLEGILIALGELAGVIIGLEVAGAIAEAIAPGLMALAAALAAFGAAAAGIGIAAAGIGAGMLLMVKAAKEAYPLFKEFIADVVAAFDWLQDHWDEFKEWVGEQFKKLWEWIKKKLGEWWESTKEGLKAVWKWIKEKAKGVWDAIVGKLKEWKDAIVKKITDAWEKLKKKIKEKWEAFKKKVKDAWDSLVKKLKDTWEEIKKKPGEILEWLKEKVGEFWDWVTEKIDAFWESVTGFFGDLWDSITGWFGDIIEEVGKKVSEFLEKGKEIVTNIKDGASQKFQEVIDTMVGFISDMKEEIKKKIEDFINIGKDIVEGLKKGISEKWNGFTQWTGEKFDGLVQGWNNFWDINSPSKLTAEMGQNIMEGFVVGMNDKASAVGDAIDAVNNFAETGLSKFLDNMYKDLDEDLHYEPVISPVVDLTDYWDGMEYIDSDMESRHSYSVSAGHMDSSAEAKHYYENAPTMPDIAKTSEDLAESVGQMFEDNTTLIQNELKVDQTEVIESIERVRNELVTIRANMHNMQVMLDSGAIVGGIIDDVDRALGQRSILAERGV